jgi:hypothetical protein
MALQINLPVTAIGLPCGAAYARVATYRGNKDKVYAWVEVHATSSARENQAAPVAQHEYEFDLANLQGPLLPAIYGMLKLLPDFVDALDC